MKQSRLKSIGFIFALTLSIWLTQAGCRSTHINKDLITCPSGTKLVHETDMGEAVQECEDKDGITHGARINLYANGQIRLKGNYKNGYSHGKFVEWYENGKKKAEFEFHHGEVAGTWLVWNEDGSVEGVTQFYSRENKRMQLVLRGDGTKHSEGELGNQLIRNGRWTFWHPNGQIKEEGEYANHKKTGLWIQYDEKGNVIKRIFHENDVEVEAPGDIK